jgi:hypothetical protein
MRPLRSHFAVRWLLLATGASVAAFIGALLLDRVVTPRKPETQEVMPELASAMAVYQAQADSQRLSRGAIYIREGLAQDNWGAHQFPAGTEAVDFLLRSADGDRTARLRDLRASTPVVLLFGSFGCNLFCNQLERLQRLHHEYRDRAAFFFVYCDEGPHRDVLPWQPGEDRLARIRRGLKHFGLTIPCLLADDAVQVAYKTFPARVLVVDQAGRIAVDLGKPIGPHWDLEQLETWLQHAPVSQPLPAGHPGA